MDTEDRFFVIDYETTGVRPVPQDLPIEVGIVVTNSRWEELARYSNQIYTSELHDVPSAYWRVAQAVHGLHQQQVLSQGIPLGHIAQDIRRLAREWKPPRGRLILLSDNIQFEWQHTQWILSREDMPITRLFHYCGWDTSILTKFTEFEDPRNTEHRALSDALGLVGELRRVYAEQTKTE